jgi:hypothetical protein
VSFRRSCRRGRSVPGRPRRPDGVACVSRSIALRLSRVLSPCQLSRCGRGSVGKGREPPRAVVASLEYATARRWRGRRRVALTLQAHGAEVPISNRSDSTATDHRRLDVGICGVLRQRARPEGLSSSASVLSNQSRLTGHIVFSRRRVVRDRQNGVAPLPAPPVPADSAPAV